MSMPQFATGTTSMTRDDVINQILSSIAMEELGLSHVINAEGEKLQYILGTLPGVTGPESTIDQVLVANNSVQRTLQTMTSNQMFLYQKMSDALEASTLIGPTGATGPTGPTGPAGTASTAVFDPAGAALYTQGQLVEYEGSLYMADVNAPAGIPGASEDYTLLSIVGATGPAGANGSAIIKSFDAVLAPSYTQGQLIEYNGNLYTVDRSNPTGIPDASPDYTLFSATGPAGAVGATGATGPTGAASVVTFDPLKAVGYMEGQLIEYADNIYLVNTTVPVGTPGLSPDYTLLSIAGPAGAAGATGATGATGADGTGAIVTLDSGSYNYGLSVPPSLLVESALLGLAATNVLIGNGMWGPEVSVLGAPLSLSAAGLPPWPMKITAGGEITGWSASFEAIAVSATYIGTAPRMVAELWSAPPLPASPDSLLDLSFTLLDTMDLGPVPLVDTFIAFAADQEFSATIIEGAYLIVRFSVDSNLVATVNGFHAQAAISVVAP